MFSSFKSYQFLIIYKFLKFLFAIFWSRFFHVRFFFVRLFNKLFFQVEFSSGVKIFYGCESMDLDQVFYECSVQEAPASRSKVFFQDYQTVIFSQNLYYNISCSISIIYPYVTFVFFSISNSDLSHWSILKIYITKNFIAIHPNCFPIKLCFDLRAILLRYQQRLATTNQLTKLSDQLSLSELIN